jgi:uncharacterized membrane protein
MLDKKDYTTWTIEELLSEQKKMASQKTLNALIIGLIIGIAFWSATHKGALITFAMLILAGAFAKHNSDKVKGIETEISRRDSVQ